MSRRSLLAVCLAALILAVGGDRDSRRSYTRTLDTHTRKLVLYQEFATALILRATLLTEDFRAALADERRRLLGAHPEEHAAFLAQMHDDVARWHEVVFSAESPSLGAVPTFGTPDDTWAVRLIADGALQPLAGVERLRAPTPLQDALYPHRTRWATLWVARFERAAPEPAEVVFEVGGGLGRGAVTWSVR